MKVLLIYPRWNYPTFGEWQEPLGLLSVGAALKSAGHGVRLVDLSVEDISAVDQAVLDCDLAGITAQTALYGRACQVLDRIKQTRPDLPVILGGPHATVRPEEALSRGFDAVVIGEGEHTAVELAGAILEDRPLSMVPGVMMKEKDRFLGGPPRPFEPDLDRLPDADRTLFNYAEYFRRGVMTHVGLMAGRGCPWNCLFCKPMQDKLFGRKLRWRSVGRIVAEMAWIKDRLGASAFIFKDDTLVMGGVEWFLDLERELLNCGLLSRVSFSCQARVDQITRPLLEQMKRCGMEGIAFGVESGSQRILDFYRKGIKVEDTVRAFDLCHQMGVGTHAFIMLGAPEETRQDLEATIRLIERIRPNSVSVSITTPAPGTALFDFTEEHGLSNLTRPEDADYHYNREPIKLKHLTMQDLAAAEKTILALVPTGFFQDQLYARVQNLAGSG